MSRDLISLRFCFHPFLLFSPGSDKAKNHRTRKRKGKLPKNCNPDVQPDPERWLPKYERSGFRKKRDRRVKEVMKGSQGMATGAADQ